MGAQMEKAQAKKAHARPMSEQGAPGNLAPVSLNTAYSQP